MNAEDNDQCVRTILRMRAREGCEAAFETRLAVGGGRRSAACRATCARS